MSSEQIITCEAAIVGGGSAGLAAALLLARARRKVIVIDSGQPRNQPSSHARGFISRDGLAPVEILKLARHEARGYGVEFIDGIVERLDSQRTLHLSDGRKVQATRVLLTTGLRDVLPDVEGLKERWGRDVLHCPYCHAYDAGQVPFVVLGSHPNAVHHSLLLKQWTPEVTLVTDDLVLSEEDRVALDVRGVRVVEGRTEQILVEDDKISGVRVSGQTLPCSIVFLFPEPRPRDEFTAELNLERNSMGFPVTDPMGCTSVPWLYAAGNAVDPRAQALTAAGHGQQVAFAMHNSWVHEEVHAAVGRRQ